MANKKENVGLQSTIRVPKELNESRHGGVVPEQDPEVKVFNWKNNGGIPRVAIEQRQEVQGGGIILEEGELGATQESSRTVFEHG